MNRIRSRGLVALSLLVLSAPAVSLAEKNAKGRYEMEEEGSEEPRTQPSVAPRRTESRGGGGDDGRALLERYKREPAIGETQEAALRYADLDAGRASGWRTRARIAPIVPELTGEYRRNEENDRTLGAQTSGNVDYSSLDDDHRYTARARWELDRLIFNPEELRISAEATDLVKLREDVLDQVTKLYFERRRLQLELDTSPPGEVATLVKKQIRLQELTAGIDALTGGWFSQKLREKGLDPY